VFSGLGVWMASCVVSVVYVLLLRDAKPADLPLKIGLGVVNGVMISVFDKVYQLGSQRGNEWENHRTEQDFQDALISKSFIFKFFNSFSSLFYLSFVRPYANGEEYYVKQYENICKACKKEDHKTFVTDYAGCVDTCGLTAIRNAINVQVLDDLRLQLASLFVTAIVIQNIMEIMLPYIMSKIGECRETRAAEQRGEKVAAKSDAEEQMLKSPNQNTIDDMSEMVVQFGYVTMFVIALPITPLLALINNIIELKVDGYKIVHESQRPHTNGSSGLGAWNGVLAFFSIVAVGTNVALITWRTSLVNQLVDDDPTIKWVFFSFVSIFLGLIVGIEKCAIPDTPVEVQQGIERQRLIENILVLGAHIDLDGDDPPKQEIDVPEFAFDPVKDFVVATELPTIPVEDLNQPGKSHTGA